jgi:signal transduction histidine kinase
VKKATLFLVTIAFWLASGTAQTRIIDSLKRQVWTQSTEQGKLKAILQLCEESRSLHRDTLEYYANYARRLAAKVGDQRDRVLAELAIANMNYRWGWIDTALAIIDPVIKSLHTEDNNVRDLKFKLERQKALYLGGQLRYSDALTVLYKLVNEAEKYRDTLTIGANINTIGSVALQRSAPRIALTWLQRALIYNTHDLRYEPVLAAIYTNMADAYLQLQKLDSAEYYIRKGVGLFSKEQNLSNLAHALQRQSSIYIRKKEFDKAEMALRQMIDVRRQTNDGAMWLDDNLTLVDFYLETGQADKAIELCRQALLRGNVADSSQPVGRIFANNVNLRLDYYQALARAYKYAGRDSLYQETLERIISAKDSFYLANSAQAIAEVQTKYEVQKKENLIIQQKLDLTRKNNLFYLTVAAVVFVAVVALILFESYRRREKLKVRLMLEKEKDMAQKAVATAEENERKRIAADLHDNLGAYAASIASNLDVIHTEGRDDQEIIALHELHNNSRSIVSQLGDTIWALNKEALTLTAISDRLKILVKRIAPSYPQIEIEVTENVVQDTGLPPTQAFHLYQIVQEALVNAVRHSGGNRVQIHIEAADSWQIIITDNGRGIWTENSKLTGGGNGMENMRKRASTGGWVVNWKPATPSGTTVSIGPTTI